MIAYNFVGKYTAQKWIWRWTLSLTLAAIFLRRIHITLLCGVRYFFDNKMRDYNLYTQFMRTNNCTIKSIIQHRFVVCSNFSAVINRIHCSVIMISSVNIISTYHSKRLAMFLCSTLDCCLIVAQKRARYNDNHCFGQQQGFFIPNSKFGSVQIDGERTMANVIVCIQ